MIGSLCGKPEVVSPDSLIIDVNGVGYRVFVPTNLTENALKGKIIRLFIYTHLRDEALDLYGFATKDELELFKILLSVAGIGPRTALAILNNDIEEIRKAVATADVEFFTSIPRLGKKNAQRIIIELKPKIGTLSDLDLTGETTGETRQVIEALCSLGFSRKEVVQIIHQLPKEKMTVEEKIAAALKLMGKR